MPVIDQNLGDCFGRNDEFGFSDLPPQFGNRFAVEQTLLLGEIHNFAAQCAHAALLLRFLDRRPPAISGFRSYSSLPRVARPGVLLGSQVLLVNDVKLIPSITRPDAENCATHVLNPAISFPSRLQSQ